MKLKYKEKLIFETEVFGALTGYRVDAIEFSSRDIEHLIKHFNRIPEEAADYFGSLLTHFPPMDQSTDRK